MLNAAANNNFAPAGVPAPPSPPARAPRARRAFKGLARGVRPDEFTPEARKAAACVLEVLAGVRTPEHAARALNLSLATYYNLEARAVRGLLSACGPVAPGRSMVLANRLRGAEARAAALEQQVQRYQALLRAAQRTVGLPPPPPLPPRKPGTRRKKPAARALRAAAALRAPPDEPAAPPPVPGNGSAPGAT